MILLMKTKVLPCGQQFQENNQSPWNPESGIWQTSVRYNSSPIMRRKWFEVFSLFLLHSISMIFGSLKSQVHCQEICKVETGRILWIVEGFMACHCLNIINGFSHFSNILSTVPISHSVLNFVFFSCQCQCVWWWVCERLKKSVRRSKNF